MVHWDTESGRSSIVYLKLERCNGTLTWCKPSWSGLKATHSSSQPDFSLSINPEDVVSPGLLLKVFDLLFFTTEVGMVKLVNEFDNFFHIKKKIIEN